MRNLTVDLPGRAYEIKIGYGLIASAGNLIRAVTRAEKVAIVTDTNVGPIYLERVENSLRAAGFETFSVVMSAGEKYKNITTLAMLYERFAEEGMTRTDAVVALGGGVTGDVAGFAAATMFRGMDFIQIPTTLLAQVDSSVGGKTAIDLPQGKNLVGTFYQPKLVIADPSCFKTLPERFICDGMAEVIKYGVIADEELLEEIESIEDISDLTVRWTVRWEDIVYRCCDIKRELVVEDERDTGRRGILNFGHTLGHAYEMAHQYETYTHGEAVAAGMVKMLELEMKMGIDVGELRERLINLLKKFHLPLEIECSEDTYRSAIELDKKGEGRRIRLIEVEEVGTATIVPVDKEELFNLLGVRYE